MGDAEEWLTTLLAVEEVFPTSNSVEIFSQFSNFEIGNIFQRFQVNHIPMITFKRNWIKFKTAAELKSCRTAVSTAIQIPTWKVETHLQMPQSLQW
jgi:hypothetical protein